MDHQTMLRGWHGLRAGRAARSAPLVRLDGTKPGKWCWTFWAGLILVACAATARANVAWTLTTTGDWSAPSDWSGGAVPTSSDNADIFNGGTATITQTGAVCYNLSLGNTAGSGSVQMTGGSLTVSTWYSEFVGDSGKGSFSQSGGTNTVDGELVLGSGPGSSGTYSLSGTGLLSAWYEYVGYSGTGTFTQSGGTNAIANAEFQGLFLGYSAGSSGHLHPQRGWAVVRPQRIRRP